MAQPQPKILEPINYSPEPTIEDFHQSNAIVKGVRGPEGCLSSDTEYLSPDGWKCIDQYDGGEVMQWDHVSGLGSWVVPLSYIKLPEKEFIHFRNSNSLSMVLTPEHRVPVYDWSNTFKVKSAARLAQKMSRHIVPTTFFIGGDGVNIPDELLRLGVAINADAHFAKRAVANYCTIVLRKDRKKKRLKWLLSENNITFKEGKINPKRPTEIRFVFYSPYVGKHYNSSTTIDWYALNSRQLAVVIDEMQHWDGEGWREDDPETVFSSACKSDIDYMQFAAHAIGGRGGISIDRSSRENENWKDCYKLQVAMPGSQKAVVGLRGDHIEVLKIKSPDGFKYCFTVPSSFFVARHDNKIFITGNSGKSVGCFFDLFKYSCQQTPYRGVRSTRWTVVRNNYPSLLTTSLRTFEEWFGPMCIKPASKQPPIEATVRLDLPDKTRVEMMVLFLSLDVPDDVKKLKSLETTGGFLNEASEMGRWILTRLLGRCGRWPPKRWGIPPIWAGMLMDTNSCEDDHWWYTAAEEKTPEGWKFFDQPSALIKFQDDKQVSAYEKAKQYIADHQSLPDDFLRIVGDMFGNQYVGNPDCENHKWQPLGINYWLNTISGRPLKEINTLVMNEYGPTGDDVPVYPEYQDAIHCAKEILNPMQGIGITLGFDFGLMPACTFSQISPRGQKLFFDEMQVEKHGSMGIRQLSREHIVPYLLDNFLPWLISNLICGFGDPAGTAKGQTDEKTCYQILRECPTTNPDGGTPDFKLNGKKLADPTYFAKIRAEAAKGYVSLGDIGVSITPASTNKFGTRKDALSKLLLMRIDGDPAIQISPKNKILRKGLRGKYRYKRVQVGGSDERYVNAPIKDATSHTVEAAMYDCLMSSYFAYDSTEATEQAKQAKIDALDTASKSASMEYAGILDQIKQSQEAMGVWF